MTAKRWLTALSLFLLVLTASGQEKKGVWSGSLSLEGGSSFDNGGTSLLTDEPFDGFTRNAGSIEGTLGYKIASYEFKLNLGAASSFVRTTKEAGNLKMTDAESWEVTKLTLDMTESEKKQSTYKGRFDFIFRPSNADRLTIFTEGNFTRDDIMNLNAGATIDQSNEYTVTYSSESDENTKLTVRPGLEWYHVFEKSVRDLSLSGSWAYTRDERFALWDKGNGKYEYEDVELIPKESSDKIYRITPEYIDSDIALKGLYKDRNFAGVSGLETEFALKINFDQDNDRYEAANLVDDYTRWADSTRFNEQFDYLALTVEPSVRAVYKFRHFTFDGTFSLQYFADRLNNQTKTERLGDGRFDPLGNFKAVWSPSDLHRLTLSLSSTIKRPDYLQLCWFQRPGSYLDELRQGNPDLRPATTDRVALEYRLTKGKFSTGLELGDSYVKDKIEQTYRTEEVEGRSMRILTWINAGHSNTYNAKLNLGWAGTKFKANAMANINYFVGYDQKDKVTRTCDWKTEANASYIWFWDITWLARFRYQSKIIRSYSSMTEYFGLDVRISRPFLHKKLEVFAEGRDLLDQTIDTETYSADKTEGRATSEHLNRRTFLLGIKYSF